jgi:multimeric flavodoxin WrbA
MAARNRNSKQQIIKIENEQAGFLKKMALTTAGGMFLSKRIFGNAIFPHINESGVPESKQNVMKIVVLTGSPRRNGNSVWLAEQFIKGAKESGHDIFRFDSARRKVEGCTACNSCGMDGDCVLKDDFEIVRPHIIASDMVVFVTPMYYFGFSAQIKKVIDRFYAINGQIKGVRKKTAFMMTYANSAERETQPMLMHYRALAEYLGWEDVGTVVAPGVWTAGAIRNTGYGEKAYQLGKSL